MRGEQLVVLGDEVLELGGDIVDLDPPDPYSVIAIPRMGIAGSLQRDRDPPHGDRRIPTA
jgi:hypothetical protein